MGSIDGYVFTTLLMDIYPLWTKGEQTYVAHMSEKDADPEKMIPCWPVHVSKWPSYIQLVKIHVSGVTVRPLIWMY